MPELSPRTKHIGMPYHWFRNKVSSLEIDIQEVSSADQLADQFSKGLCQEKLKVQESTL